ncbi:TPA: hypothetical protein EYP38_00840, partial [Candidatus Micrarchaeota archaeon]|nr:hypothetical protein [Candidatus Micrarchaeota archaeon]
MAGTRKQKKSSKVVDLDSRRGAVRSSQIRKHATMGAPLPTSEDAETAAGGESAKIYGFSYVRRRGKRAEDVAPEPERMNSQVVIEALERELNAIMPQELRDLLELPANLRRS